MPASRRSSAGARRAGPQYGNYIMHWYDEYDIGSKNGSWAEPALDESSWKPVQIPGGFKELGVGDVPSLCWFRKQITLPDPLPQGMARLYLGVDLRRWTPPTSMGSRWAPAPGLKTHAPISSETLS